MAGNYIYADLNDIFYENNKMYVSAFSVYLWMSRSFWNSYLTTWAKKLMKIQPIKEQFIMLW